ncbi:MAG: hypothetical protein RL385_5622 [Pseudomonadota bacterium]
MAHMSSLDAFARAGLCAAALATGYVFGRYTDLARVDRTAEALTQHIQAAAGARALRLGLATKARYLAEASRADAFRDAVRAELGSRERQLFSMGSPAPQD